MPTISRSDDPAVSLIKHEATTPARPPRLLLSVTTSDGAPLTVLVAVVVATVLAVFTLPGTPAGIGVAVTGVVVLGAVFTGCAARPTPAQLCAATGIVALLLVTGWRSAEWLAALCIAVAMVATGALLIGGRTVREIAFTTLAPVLLSTRTLRWLGRGTTSAYTTKKPNKNLGAIIKVAALTIVLLVVFAALFAGADATFGTLLDAVLPDVGTVDVGSNVFRGVLVGAFTAIGCYSRYARPRLRERAPQVSAQAWMWAIPTAAVLILYIAFLITQARAMFGGDEYVQKTAGLTYADYARSGFWQLFAVTALTIVVVSAAWLRADRSTPTGRILVRTILGGLCLAALAVVASALHRMDLYMDAFGATRLRVGVLATELWLGAILVLLIVAGAVVGTRQLGRAIGFLTIAAALSFAIYNPDHRIAQANIERFERTGQLDLAYLSTLSPDATDALLELPADLRRCVLSEIAVAAGKHPGPQDFNVGRSQARDALDEARVTPREAERGCRANLTHR